VDERMESFREEHLDECANLLVAGFNAEPWNDSWTLDTARKETTKVPGFVGSVALNEGVVAFATGYREPDDGRDVFYPRDLFNGQQRFPGRVSQVRTLPGLLSW
jgi:hypothetical protein